MGRVTTQDSTPPTTPLAMQWVSFIDRSMITDARVPSSEAEDEEGKWLAVPRVRTTPRTTLDEVLDIKPPHTYKQAAARVVQTHKFHNDLGAHSTPSLGCSTACINDF